MLPDGRQRALNGDRDTAPPHAPVHLGKTQSGRTPGCTRRAPGGLKHTAPHAGPFRPVGKHTHTYKHTHLYIYKHKQTGTHIHTHTHKHTHTRIHTSRQAHTCLHGHKYKHIHTSKHMHTHSHAHTHTHTHTHYVPTEAEINLLLGRGVMYLSNT